MKAFFITSTTQEGVTSVDAWNSYNPEPAMQIIVDMNGSPIDEEILHRAKIFEPDVIIYVGAPHKHAPGGPEVKTFKTLRDIAPSVNMCHDAFDPAWHETLLLWRDNECFDLQMAIDGARGIEGIDMPTLTPFSPIPYENKEPERNIVCGFPGQNSSPGRPRRTFLDSLINANLVTHQARKTNDSGTEEYAEYAKFLLRCRMIINFSHSGSNVHHVKGRVIETALAGSVLLEMEQAPTKDWVPKEYIYLYKDVGEASEIIKRKEFSEWEEKAQNYHNYVRENYSPKKIYGEMLERIGL